VQTVSGLGTDPFDVVVIGGGIIGCGIARDAALRGLRVAIFEQCDFGGGTTAASTRIVHGGLRYLEMLDFPLVRMDLRERETLLQIAPHLVRPLEFMIPFFGGDRTRALKLRAGLALYDALSAGSTLPRRRWLSASDARAADGALAAAQARGAASYYDARVDSPERLALENVIEAGERGAAVFNYCAVVGAQTANGRVTGVRVREAATGAEADVPARVVVNATGAWFEPVAATIARPAGRIRTTKGVHLLLPPLTGRALVLYSQVDGRLLFAIPRGGLTWIGTTDTDYEGDPARAHATRQDVDYLLASVAHVFPSLRMDDVLATTAGVRALVRQPGAESSVSRMHKVVDGEPVAPDGVISVLGGKITGYRAIAEDTTDAVCRRLGVGDRRATTASTPLPGARPRTPAGGTMAEGPPHLRDLYGTRAGDVMALAREVPNLARPLSPRYPDIGAQVVFGVRHEHCRRLQDFMRRRTLLGAAADQGLDAARPAALLMGAELGWTAELVEEEIDAYGRDIAATLAFRA
jgi:glycerol-3-phosphate dehydrogenase